MSAPEIPTSIGFFERKPRLRVRLEFKAVDCWIGAFWKRHRFPSGARETHLWICLLPMFPLHFHWWSRWPSPSAESAYRSET